ncbi:hypothetical protein ACA910_011705 [Epithemia clementina (nom. ined.)]
MSVYDASDTEMGVEVSREEAIAKLRESGGGGDKEIATKRKSKSQSSATGSSSKSPQAQAQQQAKKGLMGTPRLSWCRLFWCCSCLAVVVGAIVVTLYVLDESDDDPKTTPAQCGSCHCIVDEYYSDNSTNATEFLETANNQTLNSSSSLSSSCPANAPFTNYSQDFIAALRAQTARNPYPLLDCDPYTDALCQYSPSNTELGPDAVCGLHYDDTVNCSTYQLKSYVNRDTAEAAGAFVTHKGECGACSTTQDLSVYMESLDLTTLGTRCGTKATLGSYKQGVQCFESLGFTSPCADIWTDNARNTAQQCGALCAASDLIDEPANGPAPTCRLSDCLQCDESKSGPIFKQFAGRTRRRSGLLSAIARPCSSLYPIQHQVCPKTTPLL